MAISNNPQAANSTEELPEGFKHCCGYVIPENWDVVRFDTVFDRLRQKNSENNQNVLTISAQQGLISQMDYYNTLYASEDKSGYSLLQKGDFAYNKSYSSDYTFGAIKRLEKYDKGIVSPLYICFTPKEGTSSDFYVQYFEAGRFNREIYKIAQEGARNHGLLNVSTEEFFASPLISPPDGEQKKIAEILAQCDKIIALKKERLEEERKRKKWLMHHLLNPTRGVRLKGFFGEWTTSTIGEIAKMFSGGTPTSSNIAYYSDNEIPFIRSGEIAGDCTELYLSREGYANSSAQMVYKGDLLYALYGANSGECYISKLEGAINQAILCIRSQKLNVVFLHYVLSNKKEWIVSTFLQGGQGNLSGQIIKKLKIQYPDLNEQTAISDRIQMQDIIIRKLEEELSSFERKKRALMQMLLTGLVRVNV